MQELDLWSSFPGLPSVCCELLHPLSGECLSNNRGTAPLEVILLTQRPFSCWYLRLVMVGAQQPPPDVGTSPSDPLESFASLVFSLLVVNEMTQQWGWSRLFGDKTDEPIQRLRPSEEPDVLLGRACPDTLPSSTLPIIRH